MSKRAQSARNPNKSSGSKSSGSSTSGAKPSAPVPVRSARAPLPVLILGGLLFVAATIMVIARARSGIGGSGSAAAVSSLPPTPTAYTYTIGSVRYCNTALPPFATALGFSQNSSLDTRPRHVKGVRLVEVDQNGSITRTHQDPSWTSAGYLGPQVIDRDGNIYLAPQPFINILDNPPEKANIIYRIDGVTGVMKPLIDLPLAPQTVLTPQNVYGVVGIAYDCDTHSLYASSVLGSTREEQRGRIYRIDLAAGEVASVLEGVDAIGVNVFNGAQGKRLYFGRARASDVASIALDEHGNFKGDVRIEFAFEDYGASGKEYARLLTFRGVDQLVVQIMQFDFNLIAPTRSLQTGLEYRYDAQQDRWTLVTAYPVET